MRIISALLISVLLASSASAQRNEDDDDDRSFQRRYQGEYENSHRQRQDDFTGIYSQCRQACQGHSKRLIDGDVSNYDICLSQCMKR